ncbi:MAG: HD domain-containing protein [Anaerolineales bacterium]|nr:HD domain-containing protein [Anaerolineales bacterium]
MAVNLLPACFAALRATGDPRGDVRRFLLAAERPDTLRHVSRVAAAGRRLARRLGLPLGPVTLAAMAHDLAAVTPLSRILTTAEALGVPLSAADRAIPQVVHGAVAAAVLRQALGVDDAEVLNAVTYHTTLRAGASAVEQLVFVADKLAYDPTATALGYHPALWAARDTASLPDLCRLYLDWVVRECPALGWRLHPHLLAAWQALTPPRA